MKSRMGRYIVSVLASLMVYLLSGCQQAPQEVVDQMEKYRDNPQAEETIISYCSPEQLRKASIDDLEVVPENLILPKAVDFSGIQDIGLLKLNFTKDYTKQKEKIAGVFDIEVSELERMEEELENYERLMCDDENEEKYLLVSDNGLFSYLGKSCYAEEDLSEEESWKLYETTKRLYLGAGDDADIEWTLSDQTVSVVQQVKWAENWLSDIGILSEDFTYPIRTIYLREFPDGKRRLSMMAQIRYHGVPLAYVGGGIGWDGNIPYVGQMDDCITLDMDSPYEIVQCNNNGQFEVTGYQKQEKVIDFPSAVQIAADELSGFQAVDIRKIEVLYTLSPQYNYKEENASYNKPGNKVATRPVYCFMIPFGKDLSQRNIGEGSDMCYVNVDMLTGEVTSNLEEMHYVNEAE